MEQLSRTVVAYRYSPTQINEVSAKNDIKDRVYRRGARRSGGCCSEGDRENTASYPRAMSIVRILEEGRSGRNI